MNPKVFFLFLAFGASIPFFSDLMVLFLTSTGEVKYVPVNLYLRMFLSAIPFALPAYFLSEYLDLKEEGQPPEVLKPKRSRIFTLSIVVVLACVGIFSWLSYQNKDSLASPVAAPVEAKPESWGK